LKLPLLLAAPINPQISGSIKLHHSCLVAWEAHVKQLVDARYRKKHRKPIIKAHSSANKRFNL